MLNFYYRFTFCLVKDVFVFLVRRDGTAHSTFLAWTALDRPFTSLQGEVDIFRLEGREYRTLRSYINSFPTATPAHIRSCSRFCPQDLSLSINLLSIIFGDRSGGSW